MTALNLASLGYGDRVQHELRVVDRTDRQKSSGEPYLILTLGNASGQIDTEPIWSDRLLSGWADGVDRGAVVQAVGHVARYEAKGTAKRQLKLTAPLRVLPRDGYRLEDFLPCIEGGAARLWARVDEVRARIAPRRLRRVVGLFFDDDAFRLAFERLPASIGGHHCKVGGLLLHVVEVLHIARSMAKAMRADVDVVTAGALLHDIGKREAYELSWHGFRRTASGNLLEHVVLGCLMLRDRLAEREHVEGTPLCTAEQVLELEHIILSHHGQLEFGSPVRPLTLEAEIVHRADDASAKSSDVSESLMDVEAFRDGDAFGDRSRLWRVDRRSLWKKGHAWD